MTVLPITRIGSVLAAITLASSLAACSSQSVDQACLQTNVLLSQVNVTLGHDFNDAVQRGMAGEQVDFDEVLAPIDEAIDQAQSDVSNTEVKDALNGFADAFETFSTDLKNQDLSALAQDGELDDSLNGQTDGLIAAGDQITDICTQ
ncbi:MAG: hypothetical protein ACTHXA_00885 [Gulosibacter sp.]|uniref:hypothetical protein n=1 Tax=Gulosibacter sp. TaxID=2817531 RepID=UPI003F90067C